MDRKRFINLLRWFAGIASALAGRRIDVREVPPGENAVAYQCGDTLYVAYRTRYDQYLTEEENYFFHLGLLVHELMHVLLTDSEEEQKILAALNSEYERQIFHFLANAIEDPSIEWQARFQVGGVLLKALRFTIQTTYRYAGELSPEMEPFAQYEMAMIHYGDGGFVKGQWHSEDAKRVFTDSLPVFDAIIEDSSGMSRVRRVRELFDLTRPLWKEMVKSLQDRKDILQSTAEAMEDAGKSPQRPQQGAGHRPVHKNGNPDGAPSADDAAEGFLQGKRRKQAEEMNAGDGAGTPGKRTDDKSDAEAGKTAGKAVSGTDTGTEDDGTSSQTRQNAPQGNPASRDGGSSPGDGEPLPNGAYSAQDADPFTDGGEEFEEITLTDDDIAQIEALIGNEEMAMEEVFEDDAAETICDGVDISDKYSGVHVINNTLDTASAEALIPAYDAKVDRLMPQILWLKKQMERIFDRDEDEKTYARSGRFAMKRLTQSRMTVKVFTKHRFPSDSRDMAALIVLDESASMAGSNIENARNACICLLETLNMLGIRASVMGFTDQQHDVILNHYGRFSKNKAERAKLISAKEGHNTFSGFAISYGAGILNKRKETHKLMLVVTDGVPCSPFYGHDESVGLADTKKAIADASKTMSVIGVGIGSSTEKMARFFGDRFLTVNDPADMFGALTGVLKKEVASW